MLVIVAIPYAGCSALFAFQALNPRLTLIVGGVSLPGGFGYEAMVVFLALFLLSAYAGLAAIWRWRAWQFLTAAAAWATMGFSAAVSWFLLNGGFIGLPSWSPVIGVAVAVLVLLASGALTAHQYGRSYLAQHWRGQLTLSESYWRNALGGGLLLTIVEYVVGVPVLVSASFRLLPAMLIFFVLANSAFLMWVGVSIGARRTGTKVSASGPSWRKRPFFSAVPCSCFDQGCFWP